MDENSSSDNRSRFTMKDLAVHLILACCLILLRPCHGSGNRGYVFTAPKRFLAGEIESGCISLHNLEPPAHVTLELLSSASEEEILTSTSTIVKTGVETCLELAVPTTTYSTARLRLKINFEKYPDYVVEAEKEVYIEYNSLITFVETDKPVYKPGQDVNIRVLMLKHDLKPWNKAIPKIWIENPSEVRVAQWTNVTTETGMVQLKFPLSPEPSSGTWKVKVEKMRAYPQLVHTSTFEVKKYVLPRFQVTISPPGYILADAENVTWNICAKYSYGKPVKGTLLLKSTPQTPSWRRKLNVPEIHYETELDTPDGCTEFVLSGAVLGLAHWKVAPNNIVLIANFTEAGTGVVETVIGRTAVVHQALKLEFVPHTPKYFKLGLPYHGKLRVLRHDDVPAPNEKIQVCLRVSGKNEPLRVVVECRNFTSSADGFVDFIVPPPHKNIILLSFQASGVDYPTKYYSPDKRWRVFMDQPSTYVDVNPWYSPSDSYLTVARGYQPIVCGEKYSFNVMYTMPSNLKQSGLISFHYSINSRSDLLIYGHVKHKPSRDTILNYSEFRNLLGAVEPPANKTEQDVVVHRFPLSVKVTPSMAPVSELLLYYVRADGEIVATTYTIEVGHCFENKVKTAWHTDVQAPGTSTQYHVEATPWSYCGISVVDKSTLFLAGSKTNLLNAGQAFDQLKRFQPVKGALPAWPWRDCRRTAQPKPTDEEIDHLPNPAFRFRRKRLAVAPIISADVNYVDATQAFDDFGVVVMSDLTLETRPCLTRSYKDSRGMRIHYRMRDQIEPERMFSTARPLAYPLLNFEVTAAAMGPEVEYVDQPPDQSPTLRSYFPETWLWDLVSTGKDGKTTIAPVLPHTITDWVGYTACISPTHGLGIAPPTTITAFQPFFLDYTLPYSVKRGEILRLKVSLFNYMQHSLPVKIKLEDATGLDLHLSHAEVSFCVKPRDSVVQEYLLRSRVLGEVNITVSASIDSEYTYPCGPETLIFTRDIITKPVTVLPEGFPLEVTKSAFICPKDFSDDSAITWNLELPEDLVPDSGRAYVSLIGDILGPALENLDNLVRLPRGCGEQNMVLFVPNIHVIGYLDAIKIDNPVLRARAINNMEKGYQRELIYRHPDGSYSAFGPQSYEATSSIWLTAFVVKSFAQARKLIHIDERDLKLSVKWIVKEQLENGCFPVIGRVFHKDMKGGLQEEDSSSSALTAYILISLLESDVPLSGSLINNALYCLEKGLTNSNDEPYTVALTTYALALLEHPKANSSMKMQLSRATRHNDLLWWEDKSNPSVGLSIEMTAYGILSLVKLGGEENMVEALKAVRWISKLRNAEGGFTSTQDTVLGLEALTKYAIAMNTKSTDLSVLVTAGEVDHVYRMNDDTRMILTEIRLPILPTIVEIFAEGEGCVLVQANMKYNVARVSGSEAFDLSVAASSASFADECAMQKITVCARYKMADEESNMALLEVGMISGYVPDQTSLHALLEDPTTNVKRFEDERDILTIYFDKLTGQKTCISFTVTRENMVERLEPANVKLYDYYQQELSVLSSYRFAPTCGSADADDEHKTESAQSPASIEFEQTLLKDTLVVKDSNDDIIVDKLEKHAHEIDLHSIAKEHNKIQGFKSNTDLDESNTNSRLEPGQDTTENLHTANNNSVNVLVNEKSDESGSGLVPNESDDISPTFKTTVPPNDEIETKPILPSFVAVSHELETPDGIEGPEPVYVKPNASNSSNKDMTDLLDHKMETTVGIDNFVQMSTVNPDETTKLWEGTETHTPELINNQPKISGADAKQSCPVCAERLPSDFSDISLSDIYCSANSVVKVAVRRLRKARLLLDLKEPGKIKRLRSTIEFSLDPQCSCPSLDTPGSLALILSMDDDILSYGSYSTQTLNKSFYIYGIPSVGGVPDEISKVVSTCTKEKDSKPEYTDLPPDT